MGAKIFELSGLPEVLYLDSSFIINFSIDSSKYFEDVEINLVDTLPKQN